MSQRSRRDQLPATVMARLFAAVLLTLLVVVTWAQAPARAAGPLSGAQAAQRLGGLLVYPGASIDKAAIFVRTSGGCPAAADSYYVKARGHGFPAGGLVVTMTTDAGLSHRAGFDAYFGLTMMDFAADNKTTLKGVYDITLYCIESFSQQSFGEYTGSIRFGSATSYEAVGAARPTASPSPIPIPMAQLAEGAAPEQDQAAVSPAADGAPVAAARPSPPAVADHWWAWLGAVAVLIAGYLAYRRRRAWLDAGPRRQSKDESR